ncbi:MAG: HYR domain-containing protein, partial [Flavobacteriales bacterium]
TASDNCDNNVTVVQVPAAGTIIFANTLVTVTATDDSGNTVSCSFDVTPSDVTAPWITGCPANFDESVDTGCGFTIPDYISTLNITVSDNCDPNAFMLQNPAPGTVVFADQIINVTAFDDQGNMSVCAWTIHLIDTSNPIIVNCAPDQIVSADANCEFAMIDYTGLVVANDNCDANLTYVQNPAVGTIIAGGASVTITVTDDAGNSTTCTFNVSVNDDTDPIIVTCAPDVTEQVDSSCEFGLLDYTNLIVANDNCDPTLTYTQDPIAGTIYNGHATVIPITITVTDDNGNFTTCSFNVTLEDSINPTIVCPADITVNNDLGLCSALVVVQAPVVADNCQVVSVVNDYNNTNDASGVYNQGVTTINWIVTDINGNTASCTMTVTVNDNEQPVITCPADITVNNDAGSCDAFVTVSAIANTDNCAVATVVNDYTGTADASATYPVGTTLVTWTVTDVHGNFSECVQTIVVVDPESPTILCPTDIIAENTPGLCSADITMGVPVIADNCSVQALLNDYNNSGNASDAYPVGTTVVSWIVTDVYGNAATCSVNVIVNDIDMPAVTCPADITVSNTPGECSAPVVVPQPVISDNCGIQSVVNDFNGTDDASGTYPSGNTMVNWTITDVNGNVSTCSMSVLVQDTEAPIALNCGYTIEVNNDPEMCGAVVDFNIPLVTDNCFLSDTTLVAGLESGSFFPVGSTEVVYEFTDGFGNTTSCNFFINVVDNEEPIVVCTDDIVMNNDPGVCGAMINYIVPSYIDNCGNVEGIVTLIEGLAPGSTFPVGTTEVIYEVEDGSGNVTVCTFNVTISDTEAPVIDCNEDIVQQDPIVIYDIIATDNCAVADTIIIEGLASGDVFPHGYTDITYVVVDVAGNTDTCSFSVLVNNPPTAVGDEVDYGEEGGTILIDIMDNDFDVDGDSIFVTGITGGQGIVTLNDDGTISYSINTAEWCGLDTIMYTLCDIYNACDTAYLVVDVECFLFVIIPEGISPNGDGVNDVFEIVGLEDYPNNELTIFNRWGHKVFETKDYDNTWGGKSDSPVTIGNGLLPKGTYYYVLDLKQGEKPIKGFFFLNR